MPRITSTLRCFASVVEPAGEPADDLVLPFAQLRRVDLRLAERARRALLIACASSMTFAACSSAFDGMQPTLRHTPPSCGQRSTSATACRDRRHGTQPCNRRGRHPARPRRSRTSDREAAASRRCSAPWLVRSAFAAQRRRRRLTGASPPWHAAVRGFASCLRACPAAAALAPRLRRSALPLETRSPFFTATDSTTPAADDGTSIVAFSVSSVISGVSSATVSPGLTSTSMTSTSLKSPRSGTSRLWLTARPPAALATSASFSREEGREAHGRAHRRSRDDRRRARTAASGAARTARPDTRAACSSARRRGSRLQAH